MSIVDPPAPRRRSGLMPRFLVIVLCLAGLVITLQFVQGLQGIIAPVFLGLNLVIVAYPLQARLTAWGLPRFVGASVTVVLVLMVLLVFLALILWSASELVQALPRYASQFNDLYDGAVNWIVSFGITPDMLTDQLAQLDMSTVASTTVSLLTTLLSNVTALLVLLVTVIMTVFFLAMDSVAVERRVTLLNTTKAELGTALVEFSHGVRRYWVVTTVFGLIVALLDVLALAIIGIPMIWVWGVLSFLTNYIPNIGFILGLIPPALLGLVEGGWGAFFAVVVSYSVLNFVLQAVVQPKFTGNAVGVTPTVSFLSLLFWAWVLGALGAILALPATLLLKAVLVDADPQARWINALIASDLKGMEASQRGRTRVFNRRARFEPVDEAAPEETPHGVLPDGGAPTGAHGAAAGTVTAASPSAGPEAPAGSSDAQPAGGEAQRAEGEQRPAGSGVQPVDGDPRPAEADVWAREQEATVPPAVPNPPKRPR